MELRCKKVKDIVLENSASASVFFRYGIDYCNGNMSLEDLSGENSANIDEVLHDLENISHQGTPFYLWPLDLLLDSFFIAAIAIAPNVPIIVAIKLDNSASRIVSKNIANKRLS